MKLKKDTLKQVGETAVFLPLVVVGGILVGIGGGLLAWCLMVVCPSREDSDESSQ